MASIQHITLDVLYCKHLREEMLLKEWEGSLLKLPPM